MVCDLPVPGAPKNICWRGKLIFSKLLVGSSMSTTCPLNLSRSADAGISFECIAYRLNVLPSVPISSRTK